MSVLCLLVHSNIYQSCRKRWFFQGKLESYWKILKNVSINIVLSVLARANQKTSSTLAVFGEKCITVLDLHLSVDNSQRDADDANTGNHRDCVCNVTTKAEMKEFEDWIWDAIFLDPVSLSFFRIYSILYIFLYHFSLYLKLSSIVIYLLFHSNTWIRCMSCVVLYFAIINWKHLNQMDEFLTETLQSWVHKTVFAEYIYSSKESHIYFLCIVLSQYRRSLWCCKFITLMCHWFLFTEREQ